MRLNSNSASHTIPAGTRKDAVLNGIAEVYGETRHEEDWNDSDIDQDIGQDVEIPLSALSAEDFLERADDPRYQGCEIGPELDRHWRGKMEVSDLGQDFLEQWARSLVHDLSASRSSNPSRSSNH